jgi:protein involved in polysaccharide export with SLBB domain
MMHGFRFQLIPAAAALLVLMAAAGGAGAQSDEAEASARRTAAARLRPGDQIALNFLRDRELSGTITVNERGEAAFPKLGMFAVSQMSIAQLQDTLRSRYAEYLRAPEFEISVLRRVAVNGEVKAPNVYLVDHATTLRDVIARAGGLTEYGSRGKVSVIRGEERLSAKNWDTESSSVFTLQSGDQVVVGRKNWFMINALSTVSTAVLVASLIITIHRR